MEQVLAHYGVLDTFKRTGNRLSGPCPIHGGSNPTQFRVSVTTSTMWGVAGVGIIGAALLIMVGAVARFGRR